MVDLNSDRSNYVEEYKVFFSTEQSEKMEEWVAEEEFDSDNVYFTVDVSAIEEFDEEIVDDLVYNPHDHMSSIQAAIDDLVDDVSEQQVECRFTNPKEHMKTKIKNLREKHIGRLLFLEGSVSKATDVRPKISTAVYDCGACDNQLRKPVPQEDLPAAPVQSVCSYSSQGDDHSAQKKMDLNLNDSEMSNFQRLRLEEPPKESGGENPKSIDVNITGSDLAGVALAGRTITIIGVMEVRQQDDKSAVLEKSIDCTGIVSDTESQEDLEPSPEDLEQIREIASKGDKTYELLANSIAPSIQGYDTEKRGLVFQKFKGIRKEFNNSSDIRGDIHVLLIGDPGTGKSRMVNYSVKLDPFGGVFTSGESSSSTGLTATATRDQEFGGGDKWTLKAGALVLADGSIAGVDELDKMDEGERESLHEALEQQQVSVAKAGITATLNARCSFLAAANPKYGRFDQYEPVYDQVDLSPTLFSRFDLVFIIQDEIIEDRDRGIASQIIQNNIKGEENRQRRIEIMQEKGLDNISETEQYLEEDGQDEIDVDVPKDLFQKYIYYANKNFSPVLDEEVEQYLEDQYVELRNSAEDEDVYPETARALESLIRLTEAAAKIKLQNQATKEHAKAAFDIYMKSKMQVDLDPDTGEFDADRSTSGSGTSASQRQVMDSIVDLLEEMAEEYDDNGYVPREDLVPAVVSDTNREADYIKQRLDGIEARDGGETFMIKSKPKRYKAL